MLSPKGSFVTKKRIFAAFDTVDHTILLNRLKTCVGIQGSALKWFASYLESRTYSVMLGNKYSSPATLTCGIPQGSILGPVLFSLYMLPLGSIFQKHQIPYHSYADDTQFYLSLKPGADSTLQKVSECLSDIHCWMFRMQPQVWTEGLWHWRGWLRLSS
uniref:Reverse transcriptase domain-containing protein n=1 Tax=Neolamprologus brichardi TaxID=32507 RepID=A0A3Q4MNS6_NEOBR